jgi:hypothetical protein
MNSMNHSPSPAFFPANYASAREAFLNAALSLGSEVESRVHPALGLDGEILAIDLAWVGPKKASSVLLSLSGTHGVEGYYGSACQTGWLQSNAALNLPPDTAVMLVHALNPHGFSWGRRVNEDNIDVNRNHVDFDAPLPENLPYEEVHAYLFPVQWDADHLAVLQGNLVAFIQRVGPQAAARAITGGQYVHPDGIFYGGKTLCWSNLELNALAQKHLQDAQRVCVLDHHTGLGPKGHTELICRHAPGSAGLALARQWWGEDVTSPAGGESASAVIDGNVRMAIDHLCPQAQVVSIAMEVGTRPEQQVVMALLADNWLHQRGQPRSSQGTQIRAQVRDAFCPDEAVWRQQAYGRAMEIWQQGLLGLHALALTEA